MKTYYVTFLVFIFIVSCSKKDIQPILNVTSAQWFTKVDQIDPNNSFGNVGVILSGNSNADKVTVRTYGDGLIADNPLILNSTKSFCNNTIWISFKHFSGLLPDSLSEFEASTVLTAYLGPDTLVMMLKSGQLKF